MSGEEVPGGARRHGLPRFALLDKVFGADNVDKLLVEYKEQEQRRKATRSLLDQATKRQHDPAFDRATAVTFLRNMLGQDMGDAAVERVQFEVHDGHAPALQPVAPPVAEQAGEAQPDATAGLAEQQDDVTGNKQMIRTITCGGQSFQLIESYFAPPMDEAKPKQGRPVVEEDYVFVDVEGLGVPGGSGTPRGEEGRPVVEQAATSPQQQQTTQQADDSVQDLRGKAVATEQAAANAPPQQHQPVPLPNQQENDAAQASRGKTVAAPHLHHPVALRPHGKGPAFGNGKGHLSHQALRELEGLRKAAEAEQAAWKLAEMTLRNADMQRDQAKALEQQQRQNQQAALRMELEQQQRQNQQTALQMTLEQTMQDMIIEQLAAAAGLTTHQYMRMMRDQNTTMTLRHHDLQLDTERQQQQQHAAAMQGSRSGMSVDAPSFYPDRPSQSQQLPQPRMVNAPGSHGQVSWPPRQLRLPDVPHQHQNDGDDDEGESFDLPPYFRFPYPDKRPPDRR